MMNRSEWVFYQQPKWSQDQTYLSQLKGDVNEFFKKYEDQNIEVVAHSLGALIIQMLPEVSLKKVKKITYLSPTLDFFESITTMMKFVLEKNADSRAEEMLKRWPIIVKERSTESFFPYFQEFVTLEPNYFQYYFSKPEVFKLFIEHSKTAAPVHEPTLYKAVAELINSTTPEFILHENTTLIIGKHDILFEPSMIKKAKQAVCAQSFYELDAAHFPHLEIPDLLDNF